MREAIGDIASVLAEVVVPVAVNGAVAWWLGLAGFLHWYLIAATGSSFAFTLAGVFTNLDEHEGLISPNFMRFSADVEAGLHGLYFGWGPPVQYVRHPPLRPVGRMVEWAVAQGITDVASLLLLAWQFIVAPMVYPLYAVLGAPARVAARSPGATYREGDSWTLTPDRSAMPAGVEEYSIAQRPVTFTALLTTVILWVVLQILPVV